MILTDGKNTVRIRMRVWDDNGYSPDWSNDFFESGSLEYDPDVDAYKVDDVSYCIDQAIDWSYENIDNVVSIEHLDDPEIY